VADDHHALAVETCQTADDGRIVRINAVAVQLFEIGEQVFDVIEGIGPLRVAETCEICQGVTWQIWSVFRSFLQPRDLVGDIQRGIVLNKTQLLDLVLQFGNRLLKIQEGDFHKTLFD
jgi:hypothetical protein